MGSISKLLFIGSFGLLLSGTTIENVQAQQGDNRNSSNYWNTRTCLMPLRLPPPPAGYKVEYLDLNKDGKPDAIKSVTHNGFPVLWLDDDGTMKEGDMEGDCINDCLLIDRNKDGIYGGQGDLIIDWVDTDNDGKADMQFVIEYPKERTGEVWPNGHYMIMLDLDQDNVFNYINWNNFTLQCWDRSGLSDFYEDYSGQTAFMKIHTSTYDMQDLRLNWENPFLFYDPDNDHLSEMAIRILDSPKIHDPNAPSNSYVNRQVEGRADWVSWAIDLDNDNTTGNEFDFDFTIGFQGDGFDYTDQVHPIQNVRGLPEADVFFMDPRYRQLTELIYPDHEAAQKLIFQRGKWNRINFVYDEDDDCSRWERVELYDPKDPFKVGWNKGGIDNNKQSDAAGDRGEWDMDNSGGAKLYISRFDGRLHLLGAENGVWRIDQNATYYQGWDRMWMDFKDPKRFATVLYSDRDNNGFFDHIEYDLDGDTLMETVIDFQELGIDDRCEVIDISQFTYDDFLALGKRMSEGIWQKAGMAVQVARQYGLSVSWYAKWMQATTLREKYNRGYWLQFYLYKDLENLFVRQQDTDRLRLLNQAYFSGDWSLIAKKGAEGFYFFSQDDLASMRQAAKTRWGKKIVAELEKKVAERREHPLEVPQEEGGHMHDYFCPEHNLQFTFRWDKPFAHYCSACQKEWTGNKRYDWAWIYEVHMQNRDYMYRCMYLYLATGNRKYADYIRTMMLDYASKYAGWFEHNAGRKATDRYSGKAFAQSLDEANWATKVAMAYTGIKPILTSEEVRKIEEGYLRPAATLLLHRLDGANWQMWHDSGLAALGIALESDSIVDVAINKEKYGYRALVKKHKNADGWINEGSPHYHYYPLEALLFTANAVRCRGIDLFDRDLHDMFVEPVKGTYPDLSFPAHSDGWYGANLLSQSALYEVANVRYHDPLLTHVLGLIYAQKKRLDPEALLGNRVIEISDKPLFIRSYSYDESGFCLLRNNPCTVVLKFGGEGIGHGHPDKLSITIHNGREEIISDFGTSGYGTPDYLKWYKRTLSHNTVTVDGKDQKRSTGKLVNFIPRADGGYAEAMTDQAYPGVSMNRSLDLSDSHMKDVYSCTSDTLHQYEYVMIFNERPVLQGTPQSVKLEGSEPHKRIRNTMAYPCDSIFTCSTSDVSVRFSVLAGLLEEVVVGEASGIPANPMVEDGPGAGDKAVKPCYPVILRIKGKDMKVQADWELLPAI